MAAVPEVLLEVDHLSVQFFTRRGRVQAVRDVSFSIARGETLGLVGESGSGKSVTAQALLGLIELPGRITEGDVRWKGQSLVHDAEPTLRRVRGHEIAMIFQDPMTSLNPLFTVGAQIAEVLRQHMGMSKKAARARAVELLDLVGIASPAQRAKQHPHEMSGGMRQRVLIAMALACEPQLLIADEPTTALDVTIQAQILELIAEIQSRLGLAVLLITHDLGVVAGLCDRVSVMYAGKLVELGARRRPVRPAPPPLHRRPAPLDPAPRRGAGAPRFDRRGAAGPRATAAGVPVPGPLRTGHRAMRRGDAASRCEGGGSTCRLLARSRHRRRLSRPTRLVRRWSRSRT